MMVPVTLLRALRELLSLAVPEAPQVGPLPRAQVPVLAQPGPRVPVPIPASCPASVGSCSPGQWTVLLATSSARYTQALKDAAYQGRHSQTWVPLHPALTVTLSSCTHSMS